VVTKATSEPSVVWGQEESLTPIGPGIRNTGPGSGTGDLVDKYNDNGRQSSGAKPPAVPVQNAGYKSDQVITPGEDDHLIKPVGKTNQAVNPSDTTA
jgi:hypothetical protein